MSSEPDSSGLLARSFTDVLLLPPLPLILPIDLDSVLNTGFNQGAKGLFVGTALFGVVEVKELAKKIHRIIPN